MRWTLAGRCALAVFSLSVALSVGLKVTQKPRFLGVRTGRNVFFTCLSSEKSGGALWFKADTYLSRENERRQILVGDRTEFQNKSQIQDSILYLRGVRTDDNGVYYCKIRETWGPGTELQAAKPVDPVQALHRSRMKDGLMILQGLLLAVCVAAVLIRRHTLLEKNDSIYEEAETDHIYEGLAIETCGGDLYEELDVYCQADVGEAPWE